MNTKISTFIAQSTQNGQGASLVLAKVRQVNLLYSVRPVVLGSGGSMDYSNAYNKPSINGVTLEGNKTLVELGINIINIYSQLQGLPSINGVTLEGNKTLTELGINIINAYSQLQGLPSINGVTLEGNKTLTELGINIINAYSQLQGLPSINGVTLEGNKTLTELGINIINAYSQLQNLPSINGVTLEGNKTLSELGIEGAFLYSGLPSPAPLSGLDLSTMLLMANAIDCLRGETKNKSLFDKILSAVNEPYRFFVKSSATVFMLCTHNTINHSTYSFTKDANDDFWKLSTIFTGAVQLSGANLYQAAPGNRTGTFLGGTVGNLYTITVGDMFTLNVIGEKISMYSYCDNRGGMWEFTIDGDTNNKVYLSTYNDVGGMYLQTVSLCLPNKTHTVIAKFVGADPAHAPQGGTARGWIYYTDQASVNATLQTYTYNNNNNNNNATQLTYGDSNKEIAMQLTVGSENNFFPDHGVGTAFNRLASVIRIDGIPNNLLTIPTGAHIGFMSFEFDQFLHYRLPLAGNVAQVDVKYRLVDRLVCKCFTTFLQSGVLYPYYPLMLPANGVSSKIKSDLGVIISPVGDNGYTYYQNEKSIYSDFAIMANSSNDSIVSGRVVSKKYTSLNNIFLWDRLTAPKIYYDTPSRTVSAGDTAMHEVEFIAANIKNANSL